MNIRELAELDLSVTLEDNEFGYGMLITITDPDGLSVTDIYGQTNDIAFQIDPQTGQIISGRTVTVAVRISTLTEKGFVDMPKSQSDKTKKPWVFEFDDINGNSGKFIVKQSDPDRTLGLMFISLEVYK